MKIISSTPNELIDMTSTPATHQHAQHAQHAQYAQHTTQRKDEALSAVHSAHAERTTQHILNNTEQKQADKSAAIDSFEAMIDRLYTDDIKIDDFQEESTVVDALGRRGIPITNTRAALIYGEKQKLVDHAHRYIATTKQDKQELRMQIALAESKASDFEEQLEGSLSEQDETDLQLEAKSKEIAALMKRINKIDRYGIPLMSLVVFYTYMCGHFGIGMVIYSHLWVIGMSFYTIGWTIQTSFMIGANTTEFLIDASHVVCTFIVPA